MNEIKRPKRANRYITLPRNRGSVTRPIKAMVQYVDEPKSQVQRRKRVRFQPSRVMSALTLVVFVFTLTFAYGLQVVQVSAATGSVYPDADVTRGWPTVSGCTTTTHFDCVNEATNSTVDYVSTGTGGTTGEIEEYAFGSVAGTNEVSEVTLTMYAHTAACVGNATNCDQLSLNLRIGGVLQTAQVFTMTTTNTAYTATFTGTWTGDADLQAEITRTRVGGGNAGAADDDVQITSLKADVTYTVPSSISQGSYRWMDNADSASVLGATTFAKAYGASRYELSKVITPTSDGGYIIAGHAYNGFEDYFLQKFDSSGAITWTKTYNGAINDTDTINDIIQTSDGGYVSTGEAFGYAGSQEVITTKFDSSGNITWTQVLGTTSTERGHSVLATQDGNFTVIGETNSFDGGIYSDILIVKYTSAGALVSAKTIGLSTLFERCYDAIELADASLVMSCESDTTANGTNASFVKIDSNSTALSVNTLTSGGTGLDEFRDLIGTSDGGFIAVGRTFHSDAQATDVLVAKYSSAGALSWYRAIGGINEDTAKSIISDGGSGFIVLGSSSSYGQGMQDAFYIGLTDTGTVSWAKTLGGASGDVLHSGLALGDGNILAAGETESFGGGSADHLRIKFTTTGAITNCGSTICTSPTPTVNSTGLTASTDTYTTTARTLTSNSPTLSESSLPSTETVIVAVAGSGGTTVLANPLAAQDTAASATTTQVRLRFNLGVTVGQLAQSGQSFKLQYASRGTDGVCDTSFTSESYSDVGATGWTRASVEISGISERSDSDLVSFNDKLWVLGGSDSSIYRNDVWSSTDGDTWTQVTAAAPWAARYGHKVLVYNNKMWLMGGYSPSHLNDVWSTPDGVTWTQETAAASWSGRLDFAAVVHSSKMWVAGGLSSTGDKNDVWSSSDGITWTQATATAGWSIRDSHGLLSYDNKLWVLGGYDNATAGSFNDVWSSADGITWTRATATAWSTGISSGSVEVHAGKMWLIGGFAGSPTSLAINDVWNSIDGVTWSNSVAEWSARYGHSSTIFNDNIFVGMGYSNATASSYNDFWSTPGSTAIGFTDNSIYADGDAAPTNSNDPTQGAATIVKQSYEEANPFTNGRGLIGVDQYGMWDFSLSVSGSFNDSYCFRVVKADGNLLNTYSAIPQLSNCAKAPTESRLRGGKVFCGGARQKFMWAS